MRDSRSSIVVGGGVAGLYAALIAADEGADVVLLSKGPLFASNSYLAQGGVAAAVGERRHARAARRRTRSPPAAACAGRAPCGC